MSFDLFGMMEQQQATGLPFGQGINSAGMADRQRDNDRGGNPRRPAVRRPQPVAEQQMSDPFMDQHNALALQQMFTARDMADNTSDAIRREMDRRVAITREMRRMQHEKELKRMELDALIQRLGNAGGLVGGGG